MKNVNKTASTPTDLGSLEFVKPNAPSYKFWIGVGLALVAIQFPLIHYYVLRSAPEAPISIPYANDFHDAATVQTDFFSTGGYWRVVNGELLMPSAKNNPLWLKAKLPHNVVVEFDVRTTSQEGDLKVELFGDGSDHASGYIFIHGGWNNSQSIIARLDEHGTSWSKLVEANNGNVIRSSDFKGNMRVRVENPQHYPVQANKTYHWKISRMGGLLTWSIDGQVYQQFDDPIPLEGEKHNRFAFSGWETQVFFDNLRITPL